MSRLFFFLSLLSLTTSAPSAQQKINASSLTHTQAIHTADTNIIQNACTSIDTLCTRRITIPYSAYVEFARKCPPKCCTYPCDQKKCTTNSCTWNCGQCVSSCCFVKCGNFLGRCLECGPGCDKRCVKCSGFSKQHCGEQCHDVPCTTCSEEKCGLSDVCTEVPVALKIRYRSISPCSVVPVAVQIAIKSCPCLLLLKKVVVIPEGSATYFKVLGELVECTAEKIGKPLSNEAEEVGKLSDGNDYIILGPKIGLKLYASTTASVAGCVAYGTCDAIAGIYLDYFREVGLTVGKGFVDFAQSFFVERIADTIEKEYLDIAAALRKVFTLSDECKSAIQEEEFRKGVETLERIANDFDNIVDEGKEFKSSMVEFIDNFEDVIKLLDTGYKAHILNMIKTGEVPELSDAVDVFKDAKELKDSIETFRTLVRSIKSSFADLEILAKTTSSVKTILSQSSAACKDTVLQDLQELVSLRHRVANVLKDLANVDLDTDTVQTGFVTFQKRFEMSLTLPCSRITTKSFSLRGLSVRSPPFPEFYACIFRNVLRYNEHVSYLRLNNLKF